MSDGVALWNRFVADGVVASQALAAGLADLPLAGLEALAARTTLRRAGDTAFSLGLQALLVGAEPVGRLAVACERVSDAILAGAVEAGLALPYLAAAAETLRQAFAMLAAPDKSGARIEGLPLEGARFELETLLPVPGSAPVRPAAPDVPAGSLVRRGGPTAPPPVAAAITAPGAPAATATPVAPPAGEGYRWTPTVDDDMVELFFAEADERLEALAVKLVDVEARPDDAELLREIFRDLHTVKGSSAMVGLEPMRDLAHAAEDLVGQLRDGSRRADGAIVDALLAALDALREIATQAAARGPIAGAVGAVVARLRDPARAVAPAEPSGPAAAEVGEARERASQAARQTIRVDFDKLDRLLNLVGELVLGRDGLRGAVSAIGSLGSELSADRHLARRLVAAGPSRAHRSARAGEAERPALTELRDELGRVERVLVDIGHELDHSSGRLDSVSGELRDAVMKLRMVPVAGVFRKHHRTVRDLAQSLGKQARLILAGDDTELDKVLVEALDDPLMHLIRNAVDHGLEPADERLRAGKPAEGTVHLRALHRGNQVVIEIQDDGRGIDPAVVRRRARERDIVPADQLAEMDDRQVLDIIFRAGFSTAKVVSEVSGRGVGMDVVRQSIVTHLKGQIDIASEVGKGSTFTLSLPLTLAIMHVLLARAGGEVFAIPLDAVVRTLVCPSDAVHLVQHREVLTVRDRQVALIRLAEVLELGEATARGGELHVILIEHAGDLLGLVCEGLIGKKEIVIKSLGELLRRIPCAAGATLIGDRCAVILDLPAVIERALRQGHAPRARPEVTATAPAAHAPRVLLVEDSDVVRETLRRLLVEAGYQVTQARDGAEGLELALASSFDLISTDVMMPRMDGYELTRALRATAAYRNVPIVMVTSRGERIDRVRGFDAGVDEYITKPHDQHLLLRAVAQLLAHARKDGPA